MNGGIKLEPPLQATEERVASTSAAGGDSRAGLASLPRWSRDTYIALIVLVLITVHLAGRFLFAWSPQHTEWPLYAAFVAGIPLLFDLIRKAVHLEFGSDLIAGVSIVTAVLMHEYLVAAVVILMLSGGQALESYATRRASSVLQALARRMPTQAHLVKNSSFIDIAVSRVSPGDRLYVLPHEICPVDGEVIEGYGRMDESFLTGEPFELSKAPGAQVLSGAINGDAALTIRAVRVADDSRYARILRVVHETQLHQPRMRRIADRLGAWYTPLALAIAGFGWVISGNPERFLAVSVIATPCPLLLAIPVAILGGISLAARHGIVVRNAAVLERIDFCRTYIFDKTGTLTYGRPRLVEIQRLGTWSEDELLSFAASLENYSRHPLAKGVLDAAKDHRVTAGAPSNVSEHPGEGLRGTVDGHSIHITGRQKAARMYVGIANLPSSADGPECLIFVDNRIAGVFRFEDEPKRDSRHFIRHLGPKHGAERLILLSGDKESAVRHLAALVGIDEIYFGKSPEEKLAFVREESARRNTLFVGDGINDAPAMLAATVGVALGGSSQAISESADAVVLDSSLRNIDKLMHIARRMKRIMLESAVGGMGLSGVGMLAAATGHLSPLTGAVAQEVIDLLAVLNALRVAFGHVDAGLSDF